MLWSAQEDRLIWESFRSHSRTFSLAARLLPPPVQLPVATLYLFCRAVDTIADERVLEAGAAQALDELAALRAELQSTLAGRPPGGRLLWRRLAAVDARYGLYRAPLFELIEGATWDLEGRTIRHEDDLVRYADLVGGCVGAMMLPFLTGQRTGWGPLEAPARALGIAMQITNIVRDVGEDVRELGRVYIPADWLAEHGCSREDLEASPAPGYPELMERMMLTAETYYEASLGGIERLPRKARAGVRAASRMYREIMNEVREGAYDNLTTRAYVPLSRKLRLVLQDDYARRRARLLARAALPLELAAQP